VNRKRKQGGERGRGVGQNFSTVEWRRGQENGFFLCEQEGKPSALLYGRPSKGDGNRSRRTGARGDRL